jgi:putative membrane protein
MLLFVVGGAVLRAGLTDLYLRYVKSGLRPFLLVAGVALVLAAIATLWYELRPTRGTQKTHPGHQHNGHAHREPRIAWLLVLPVFALILVGPPALGSYTANRTGTALQRPLGFPALPAGDPVQISVLDYATRAVYDDGRSLGERQVKITGFITLGRPGAPYLTRMVLNCCAADAQPIKVGLSGQLPPVLQSDSWLEVIGTYTNRQIKDDVNDGPIPFINVSQMRAVPVPHDQYES